jgi:hypothetical protein
LRRLNPYPSEDKGQGRFNVELTAAVNGLLGSLFAEATRLSRTTVGTTETRIQHKLGRQPTGWLESSKEGDARVWQTKEPDANYLYLRASAAVVLRPIVF